MVRDKVLSIKGRVLLLECAWGLKGLEAKAKWKTILYARLQDAIDKGPRCCVIPPRSYCRDARHPDKICPRRIYPITMAMLVRLVRPVGHKQKHLRNEPKSCGVLSTLVASSRHVWIVALPG